MSIPEQRVGLPKRILCFAGGDHPADARVKLSGIGTLMIIHVILEMGLWVYQWRMYLMGLPVLGLVAALVLYQLPGRARTGAVIAAGMVFLIHVLLFPNAANHMMLLLLGLIFLAFFEIDQDDEAVMALASLRWMTLIVLFSTGLQKVFYGTYFQGEFLAWSIAHWDRFADLLWVAGSADEVDRLRRLATGARDAGVYRTQSLALLVAYTVGAERYF